MRDSEASAGANSGLDSVRKALALARDVAFLVAIYSYFVGFTYYYRWLEGLGIPASISDESPFHVFVYSFPVFQRNWLLLLLVVLLAAILWASLGRTPISRRGLLRTGLVSVTVVATFVLLYNRANTYAEEYAASVRAGYAGGPNVKVMLRPEVKRYFDQDFMYDNEHFCLAMMAQTRDDVYVLSQNVPGNSETCTDEDVKPNSELPAGFVYAIPREDIISVIFEQEPAPVPSHPIVDPS